MHVDEAAIVNDFLDNHQDLLAEHRRRLYYECQECHEWFDEDTDISQGWCKECREREQNATLQLAKHEMFGDDADMLDDDMGAK